MSKLHELEHLSLATTYEVDNNFDSDKFIKMRLRVCHDGLNPNNSHFEVEDMDAAKESIKNIPILANVLFDEDGQPQFGGHDMEIEENKTKENEYKLIYKETPIGLVPETCNYEVSLFNNKNYVFVDCYIWKDYANYAQDIIERDGDIKLSMEIIVDTYSYDSKEKYYKITDYRYQGITFLNKDFGTGMENALATTGTFNLDSSKEKFIIMMNELKQTLSSYDINKTNINKEGGSNIVDEKLQLITKYNLTKEQLEFSIEEISLEELEMKLQEISKEIKSNDATEVLFSATYVQKREALNNALEGKVERDENGVIVYEEYMYVEDFDDEYVYVEKCTWTPEYDCLHGKFTYTFDEESLTATITGEFEKMILVRVTEEENQKIQDERNTAKNEFEKIKNDFEEYKTNYSTPNSEVQKLKDFELETIVAQRKLEEEELFEKFSELNGVEEFEELKSKSSDYELNEIEKECFAILGKKTAKFSTKSTNNKTKVKIEFGKPKEEKVGEYDDILEKHIKK